MVPELSDVWQIYMWRSFEILWMSGMGSFCAHQVFWQNACRILHRQHFSNFLNSTHQTVLTYVNICWQVRYFVQLTTTNSLSIRRNALVNKLNFFLCASRSVFIEKSWTFNTRLLKIQILNPPIWPSIWYNWEPKGEI